jgi:serine/threonine-protein kinase
MAWVFEVQDPRFERRALALKVLKPDAGAGTELALFEQEAQILASIDHPNVVQIFDHGRDEASGLFYYTMTFVDGPSLHELTQKQGAIEPEQACEIMMGVLSGLEQIHNQNVVHRDITPRNILVAPGERAVLMDLGIARETVDSEATQYTQVIRGTPLYMSPEQSSGRRPTKSSDIFSLGLTFYYCLKGQTVYHETDQVDASNSHSVREYLGHLKLSQQEFEIRLPRKVPRAVRDVIRTATRLDPGQRYRDAAEMREALRAAMRASGGAGLPGWLVPAAGVAAVAAVLWFAVPPALEAGRGLWEKWTAPGEEVAETPAAPATPAEETPEAEAPPAAGDARERLAHDARAAAQAAQETATASPSDLEDYTRSMQGAAATLEQAESRFGESAWGEAQVLYDKALLGFEQARSIPRANQAQQRARELLARAEKLGEDAGRAPVLAARADNAYQAGQFEEAAETYDLAVAELEGALPANVAPRMVKRVPEEETLLLEGKGRSVAFSVEVDDIDEDPLSFRWSVDGKPQEAKDGTLELAKVAKDTDVSLAVSDGKGGELEQRWKLDVNEKPSLSVSPRGNVRLAPGQSQRFTAQASDPDGDPFTTEFFLDNQKVGSGDAFDFQAGQEGTFQLVVKTSDDHGAAISGVRSIQVVKPPPPRPVAQPEPAPPPRTAAVAPTPPPPPSPSPSPSAGGAGRDALVSTLREYESAFESCNSGRLRGIWRMSAGQIRAYEAICQEGKPDVLASPRGEWGVRGDQGWICLDYHVKLASGGTEMTLKKKGIYTGDLVKRPDGWQITDIREGCGGS